MHALLVADAGVPVVLAGDIEIGQDCSKTQSVKGQGDPASQDNGGRSE